METTQLFNIIETELIDKLISYYYSHDTYETPGRMNKIYPGLSLKYIEKTIKDLYPKLEYVTGNFYKHNSSYLPHTDFKSYQNNKINMVIPLEYTGDLSHLIIFDQKWQSDSVTWCMNKPVKYFSYNTGVKGCPNEYPVTGLTNRNIDDELYSYFDTLYPKECLFGMSGKAYPLIPGSIIIFDNTSIHATGKMNGEKLGISLRFKLIT